MNKILAREVERVCDWFYKIYPRPNPDVKVYAYKWRISFRLAILFHLHEWDHLDATTGGTYSGRRHKIIIHFTQWSRWKGLRTLFHELIHAQQNNHDNGVFKKTLNIIAENDPLEEKAYSIAEELTYCYLHSLPPPYINPMPCPGVLNLAIRLDHECHTFKLYESL